MAEETLLTAARRVVRFFNIDMEKGGLVTEDTQQAISTLDKMVRRVDANNAAYRVSGIDQPRAVGTPALVVPGQGVE